MASPSYSRRQGPKRERLGFARISIRKKPHYDRHWCCCSRTWYSLSPSSLFHLPIAMVLTHTMKLSERVREKREPLFVLVHMTTNSEIILLSELMRLAERDYLFVNDSYASWHALSPLPSLFLLRFLTDWHFFDVNFIQKVWGPLIWVEIIQWWWCDANPASPPPFVGLEGYGMFFLLFNIFFSLLFFFSEL